MGFQRWPKIPTQKPKNLTGQPYEGLFNAERLLEINKLQEQLRVAKMKHLVDPDNRDHVYEIVYLEDMIYEKNRQLNQVANYFK